MPLTNYEALTLDARLNMLVLLDAHLTEMDFVLRTSFLEIDVLMGNLAGPSNVVRRGRLAQLQRGIADILDDTFGRVEDSIVQSMREAVEIARDGNIDAAMVMFREIDERFTGGIPAIFRAVPDNATNAVLARVFDDGKLFSDRIWDLQQFSQNEISKTVAKGVLQGKSHTELMKDLEPFLRMDNDEFQAFQRVWAETHDEAWKADWKTRGRLKYNLHRLARTEINNAHREGMIWSARVSPWVESLKWNLSASHPKPDICDTWASQDLYDLGDGIYPFDSVPLDHPNGLCFMTNVLVSQEEINRLIVERAVG